MELGIYGARDLQHSVVVSRNIRRIQQTNVYRKQTNAPRLFLRDIYVIDTIKKGKAAEHIAIAKLLSLGYNVYVPTTEGTRVDLIFEKNNIYSKAQVKSFNKKSNQIGIRKTGVNSKTNTKIYHYTASDVDYFIAVDVDTLEVFMIPIEFVMQYTTSIAKSTIKDMTIERL